MNINDTLLPNTVENLLRHGGRALLGLYFLGPGLMKLGNLEFYESYMALHGVPFVTPLLWLTILVQVGGGSMLIVGFRTQIMALVLAALTLGINVFMHDFWNSYEGLSTQHETQNFVKNLGIMAGLLYVAGARLTPRSG